MAETSDPVCTGGSGEVEPKVDSDEGQSAHRDLQKEGPVCSVSPLTQYNE